MARRIEHGGPRARARTASVRLVLGLALAFAPLALATAAPATALVNPTANIAPRPNIFSSGPCRSTGKALSCANPCLASGPGVGAHSARCARFALEAINNARARLGERPLVLPSNWLALSVPEQLFVIVDLQRVSAGYPAYLGLNAALSREAQRAANARRDPGIAPGFAIGHNPAGQPGFDGAWAMGSSVLAADYVWMYEDGWGGSARATPNRLCTGPGVWACWSHRDELLGSATSPSAGVGLGCSTCAMGAGFAPGGGGSLVALIERPAGRPPAMTFTWGNELAYFPVASSSPPTTTSVPPAPSTPGRPGK